MRSYKKDVGEDGTYLAFLSDLSFQNRDFDTVKSANAKILKSHPKDYWAHYRLGDGEMAVDNIDPAFEHFKAANAANPDAPHAIERMAEIMVSRGQLNEARNALKKAISLNPAYVWPVARLAEIHNALGEYEQGLTVIDENRKATGNHAEPTLAMIEAVIRRNADFENIVKACFGSFRKALLRAKLSRSKRSSAKILQNCLTVRSSRFLFGKPSVIVRNCRSWRMIKVCTVIRVWRKRSPSVMLNLPICGLIPGLCLVSRPAHSGQSS